MPPCCLSGVNVGPTVAVGDGRISETLHVAYLCRASPQSDAGLAYAPSVQHDVHHHVVHEVYDISWAV